VLDLMDTGTIYNFKEKFVNVAINLTSKSMI
jgi:hypothetical protein